MYVNDTADSAPSTWQLFASDCPIYRVTKLELDTYQLQCGVYHLSQWAQTWQMN